jgi:parallel beta-helix repeat protein
LANGTLATNYYVSPQGKDKNKGISAIKPFQTLQKAANLVQPGDTVFVMEGLYTNDPKNTGAIVEITTSGTSDNWIVFTNYPCQKPKLKFNCWEAIRVTGASFIEINGFEIEGNNDNITLEYAQSQMNKLDNPLTCGNGIMIKEDKQRKATSHHVKIANNRIYKCGGGGIGSVYSDYLTISGNTVYNCGYYAPYACSGISIYQPKAIDNFEGYKFFITNNISHSNYNYIPFYFSNASDSSKREFTDGNGIILDDFFGSQNFIGDAMEKPYNGKCLVANNVVYNNGGSGIHTFKSSNVAIVNNTAYKNGRHEKMDPGQIFALASKNIRIMNNIMVALPGKKINAEWKNTNVEYSHNLYFDETGNPIIPVIGFNAIIANPEFVNPTIEKPDFRLKANSPCLKWGEKVKEVKYDFNNQSRNNEQKVDLGAFEF